MKKTIYLLLSVIIGLMACQKEGESLPSEQQFIGTWQQVSVQERVNGGSWQDVTDACAPNEIVEIIDDSDHKLRLYSLDPAACGSQVYKGRWDIFDEGREMVWNIDGVAEPLKKEVVEITEMKMITIHQVHIATPTERKITYKRK